MMMMTISTLRTFLAKTAQRLENHAMLGVPSAEGMTFLRDTSPAELDLMDFMERRIERNMADGVGPAPSETHEPTEQFLERLTREGLEQKKVRSARIHVPDDSTFESTSVSFYKSPSDADIVSSARIPGATATVQSTHCPGSDTQILVIEYQTTKALLAKAYASGKKLSRDTSVDTAQPKRACGQRQCSDVDE